MIKFDFSKDKFISLMQFLCEKVSGLDKLKAVKLIYFLDRECLLEYGHPILGDTYICMEYGPVPSAAYDILKSIESSSDPDSPIYISESSSKYPPFRTKAKANLDLFSEVELSCIKGIIDKYGNLSGSRLADISHKHKAWKNSERNSQIDYKLFFADEPNKHRDAYQAMLLDQEDRDFVEGI